MSIERSIGMVLGLAIAASMVGGAAQAEQWKGAAGPQGSIWRQGGVAIGFEPSGGGRQSTLLELERPLSGSTDDLLFSVRSTFRDMASTVFQIDTKRVYVGGAAGKADLLPDGVYDVVVGRGLAVGMNRVTERLPTEYTLAVGGKILAEEVRVKLIKDWADYVFRPGYAMKTLPDLEAYVRTHHHLPGVPTALEVRQQGVDVGVMQATLLEKIEELTLHVIEQHKTMAALERKISQLESDALTEGEAPAVSARKGED